MTIKVKYPKKSFRLDKKTIARLEEKKEKGISWDKLINNLLDKYGNETM
jgi:hypothetical protein